MVVWGMRRNINMHSSRSSEWCTPEIFASSSASSERLGTTTTVRGTLGSGRKRASGYTRRNSGTSRSWICANRRSSSAEPGAGAFAPDNSEAPEPASRTAETADEVASQVHLDASHKPDHNAPFPDRDYRRQGSRFTRQRNLTGGSSLIRALA